jgi:hypothetical protein
MRRFQHRTEAFTERKLCEGCSMTPPSYRNPHLVELVISALARWDREDKVRARLAKGSDADELFLSLRETARGHSTEGELLSTLLAVLQSGDFVTVPKIGHVRSVKLCRTGRLGDTHLYSYDGVDLFTDDGIIAGNRVLLFLLPPSPNSEAALTNFLIAHPRATKQEARQALRSDFPDLSHHAFDRLWPLSRKAAGLPARGQSGRPRK